MPSLRIAYYISGHGYGHAIRSVQVIRELVALGCTVWIKTLCPAFLFRPLSGRRVRIIPQGFDVGLVHRDNLRFDMEQTFEAVRDLLAVAEKRIEEERAFLAAEKMEGVVCDIPFLPLAAATRAGLPSVALGNFSWDWIYGHFGKKDGKWLPWAQIIRGYYRGAGLLLRLPFHGTMDVFERVEDIPLITRKSSKEKKEIRDLLQLPPDRKIGLIGFSRLELTRQALRELRGLASEYLLLIHSPLKWSGPPFRQVTEKGLSFIDLVRAADFVITKPGYGIVSDCLVYGTPMVYCDRGDFPEYPILVKGIQEYLPHRYLPQQDLYAGRWGAYLESFDRPKRTSVPWGLDGARQAAERIWEWIFAASVGKGLSRRIKT